MSAPAEDADSPEPGHPLWHEKDSGAFFRLAQAALGSASLELLGAFATAAVHALSDQDAGELVLDIEALVQVLSIDARGGQFGEEARWLGEWLDGEGFRIGRSSRIGALNDEGRAKLKPVLSASLRTKVLPMARAIATITTEANPEVHFRHLFLALAKLSESELLSGISEPFSSSDSLSKLQEYLIRRALSEPLNNQLGIEAWERAAFLRLSDALAIIANSGQKPSESTRFLSDNPSADDLLGRRPLVQALAIRLKRLQAEEAASPEPAAVMVHLHGAWGSGKSSLVKLLTAELGKTEPPWLVVDFNAWRNARVRPPWWNMLTTFQRTVAARLRSSGQWWPWLRLQLLWLWWQASQEALLLMLGSGLLLIALASGLGLDALGKGAEQLGKLISGAGGVILIGRALALGGGRGAAEAFDALRTDSYRPFISLFAMLVKESPAPVLIVLDDLDRCDVGTITDLLEGIQTLFRGAPVVFLAVADRRWITTSFAKRFADFHEAGGDAARPVGDLFLDKMFQLSVGVPQILPETHTAYLNHLLGVQAESAPVPEPLPPLPPAPSLDQVPDIMKATPAALRQQRRAELAVFFADQLADEVTQHRLSKWDKFIEPNPRGVKRLINAVGMAQTRAVLEGRSVGFDTIALWTMLELRWPRAADAIAADPRQFEQLFTTAKPVFTSDALKEAWKEPMFRNLIGQPALQPDYLDLLLGSPSATSNNPSPAG